MIKCNIYATFCLGLSRVWRFGAQCNWNKAKTTPLPEFPVLPPPPQEYMFNRNGLGISGNLLLHITTSSTTSIAMTKISYQRPTAFSVVMATGYASMATSPGPSLDGRGSFSQLALVMKWKYTKLLHIPFRDKNGVDHQWYCCYRKIWYRKYWKGKCPDRTAPLTH